MTTQAALTALTVCVVGFCIYGLALLVIILFFKGASSKQVHPILCAWCLDDGAKTVVGWAPVEDSHGICPPCREKWVADYLAGIDKLGEVCDNA